MVKIERFLPSLIIISSCLLFLFGFLDKLAMPLAEWDHVTLDAAENWSKGVNEPWLFDHPPLYPIYLTILFKVFGSGITVARLGNAFCVILTAMKVFQMTSKLYDRQAAVWASAVYLSNPVVIQGVTSLDVGDTSILPLLFIFFLEAVLRNSSRSGLSNTVILAFITMFCFWAKVTSTLGLVVSLGVAVFVFRMFKGRRKAPRKWIPTGAGLAVGIVLFLATWTLFSLVLWGKHSCLSILSTPWLAVHARYPQAGFTSMALNTGYDALRLLAWFSPHLVILWLLAGWEFIRGDLEERCFLGANGSILFLTLFIYSAVHMLIGGTNYGFPRYHAAIWPAASVFIGPVILGGLSSMRREAIPRFILLGTAAFLYFAFLHPDPLYFLNLRLKEMLLSGTDQQSVVRTLFTTIAPIYLLPFLFWGIFRFRRIGPRKTLLISFLLAAIVSVFALNIQQLLAYYRTAYQYGAEGKDELIGKVREKIHFGDSVLATPEFIYALREKGVPEIGYSPWGSREQFQGFIDDKRPSAIIGGLTVNTYKQLRWLIGEESALLRECRDRYDFEKMGTYFLCISKRM
ncbi:MAG: glycosyltransferase family 39 protein [Deltaproteobacteria bacterium]|nr:glycosyltransferase family 39 protein [Deltaproteobacteria bacterium]